MQRMYGGQNEDCHRTLHWAEGAHCTASESASWPGVIVSSAHADDNRRPPVNLNAFIVPLASHETLDGIGRRLINL